MKTLLISVVVVLLAAIVVGALVSLPHTQPMSGSLTPTAVGKCVITVPSVPVEVIYRAQGSPVSYQASFEGRGFPWARVSVADVIAADPSVTRISFAPQGFATPLKGSITLLINAPLVEHLVIVGASKVTATDQAQGQRLPLLSY